MDIKKNRLKLLDLFSGCGGLSYGFLLAGYDVLFGVDNWQDSLDTFKLNHKHAKVELGDLSNLAPADFAKKHNIFPGEINIIAGGPPCQGFSISGKRNVQDPRNHLYTSFVAFVDYFKPEVFVMENVPNLVSMGNGLIKDKIIHDFEKAGYKVSHKILLASLYGVPQNRRRVFFVGFRNGHEFKFPEETHSDSMFLKKTVTTYEAINDLVEDSVPDGTPYPTEALSEYQSWARQGSNGIYNHEVIVHTEKTKEIIAMVPDGGNYKSLPKELWTTRKVNIAWTRMNSRKPCFTIDTGHNHHFHYKWNRVPTARESARIQSFPDTFHFCGNKASQLKQVGNAVPPLLAYNVAKAIKSQIKIVK
jgi:DNA (cytosine-5)-methyltransferase 1